MLSEIRWVRAILGACAAELGQIGTAFLWVAVYSYFIDPGRPFEIYERHAAASGPWVSIFAGAIIFYAASRWIARSVPTALALFAIFVLIDGLILVAVARGGETLVLWPVAVSYLTKLVACCLGGRHARRAAPAEAA